MVRQALKFVIGAVLFAALALVLLIGGLIDGRPLVALLGAVMVVIAIGCVLLAVRVTRAVRGGLESGRAGGARGQHDAGDR